MDVSSFYNSDSSDRWFTMKSRRGTVHENLERTGFAVVQQDVLVARYPDLNAPIQQVRLSWGNDLPTPLPGRQTAFLAITPRELDSTTYREEPLDSLLARWMSSMPGEEKFLCSLNPAHYLFAVSDDVQPKDLMVVVREWHIDCIVGAFDASRTMMVVFDAEFEIVYLSFAQGHAPDGFDEFAQEFNARFADEFVRDAKFRTGADPKRAEEYYREAFLPAL